MSNAAGKLQESRPSGELRLISKLGGVLDVGRETERPRSAAEEGGDGQMQKCGSRRSGGEGERDSLGLGLRGSGVGLRGGLIDRDHLLLVL